MAGLSPMMQQYLQIKEKYSDCILLFRLGDFYEMFFEDAKTVSSELDLVLTGKECGLSERAPMCGVPFHSAEGYIAKLVEKGYKVAICEQVEDPATAKGLVKRDVVRIITPGTVIENSMLEEGRNNYLCAVTVSEDNIGICFCDASTGETHITQTSGEDMFSFAVGEIGRFSPREILLPENYIEYKELTDFLNTKYEGMKTVRKQSSFDVLKTEPLLLSHFKVVSTENIGAPSKSAAAASLGAVIEYLYETGVTGSIAVSSVDFYARNKFMRLDMSAVRNLEIVETIRAKSKKGTLLWVLDKTKTAMGKRLIRSWIEQPLMSLNEINLRHNAVEELFGDTVMRGELCEALTGIKDVERIISQIVYKSASARDLRLLWFTLCKLPFIKEVLQNASCRMLRTIDDDIDPLYDIAELIDSAIKEEPNSTVKEGGIIKEGYNAEVDSLREIMENGAGVIASIESRERERTGIKNLKVKYNRVFGYYIEVTNSFLDLVPEDYMRKQTLTGGERFITPELKELEGKLIGAKDRVYALEYALFDKIRQHISSQKERLQKTAAALARLDVLCSFAETALENDYVRPRFNNEGAIKITAGRHPVVEKLSNTPFVSNDTYLDRGDNRCAIITGPNMAGKSTYMRQVAIIALMAQIGCFVPAQSADLCICDAIFTRVGASDDLSSGRSTFMVEMSEVADILNYATADSLLILDEIGRGTSTFDGMAIARSVLEYIANKNKIGAKSLFATHYHELTSMEYEINGVKNYNIAVKKRGDDIIFLRRIVRGGADESYGVEVAKLAGLPGGVIKRAKEILKQAEEGTVVSYKHEKQTEELLPMEMLQASELLNELRVIDVETLTPIESAKILYDLAQKAKE